MTTTDSLIAAEATLAARDQSKTDRMRTIRAWLARVETGIAAVGDELHAAPGGANGSHANAGNSLMSAAAHIRVAVRTLGCVITDLTADDALEAKARRLVEEA